MTILINRYQQVIAIAGFTHIRCLDRAIGFQANHHLVVNRGTRNNGKNHTERFISFSQTISGIELGKLCSYGKEQGLERNLLNQPMVSNVVITNSIAIDPTIEIVVTRPGMTFIGKDSVDNPLASVIGVGSIQKVVYVLCLLFFGAIVIQAEQSRLISTPLGKSAVSHSTACGIAGISNLKPGADTITGLHGILQVDTV
ncbi:MULTISPECIES: hypothetical protein [unclassified Microbulbifer]|uniref:hypothetical protein n=1 Tax=unclassified Microbulbifer TaxID=2619833 RepID=UPI0027E3F3DF|nr:MULTISPECIES: hypothetical protein [unclassified Microbulbifer]